MENPEKRVCKLVLTGGPCGGKTTGQARLCTFFESLGWKVFRVPETATVLLSGGIKFSDLNEEQGNYVCCVCHEIDEPAPNFIVVYDLQSGTLFKKWKPSCNTVSLAISSPGGCVISGLEDARILVWDLITGNCRWCLYGHTAPVSLLRLDPTGGFCLSTDKESRDRSIRMWDINRGNLVAVYSPSANVSACEISCGGRFLLLALEGTPTSLRCVCGALEVRSRL